MSMRKIITLFAATVFAVMAMLVTPNQAEARRYRHGNGAGAAIAAAIIGGIAIAAISNRHHRRHYNNSYYDDGYAYDYRPRRSYYSSYGYSGNGYSRGYGYGGGYSRHSFGGFGGHHHRGHW
jgi:hypothetical protein